MRSRIIFFLLLFFCSINIFSSPGIKGHVVDSKTGEHLAYVTVGIKNTTVGTASDETGHFSLKNLSPGNYTIILQTVGYNTLEQNIYFEPGKDMEFHFKLEPSDMNLDEVVEIGRAHV